MRHKFRVYALVEDDDHCKGYLETDSEARGINFFFDGGYRGISYFLKHNGLYFRVEQFTGLTDQNGREVYEGDIMEILEYPDAYGYNPEGEPEKIVCTVTFQDGIFAARWGHEGCNKEYPGDGVVIGNVNENSELLKAL